MRESGQLFLQVLFTKLVHPNFLQQHSVVNHLKLNQGGQFTGNFCARELKKQFYVTVVDCKDLVREQPLSAITRDQTIWNYGLQKQLIYYNPLAATLLIVTWDLHCKKKLWHPQPLKHSQEAKSHRDRSTLSTHLVCCELLWSLRTWIHWPSLCHLGINFNKWDKWCSQNVHAIWSSLHKGGENGYQSVWFVPAFQPKAARFWAQDGREVHLGRGARVDGKRADGCPGRCKA